MASGKRVIFALAAAVTAAATMDPIVERLSNAGFFGIGNFTDHSNADVIPALCTGALFSLTFLVLAVMRLFGIRFTAHELDEISVRRMLPVIFALQLVVLFVMETTEQHVVLGHFLGGAVWLGAPAPISLALHFSGCVVVSFFLSRALRALATHVVAVVRALQRFVMLPIGARPASRAPFVELVHVFEPLLDHPTVRPPPPAAA